LIFEVLAHFLAPQSCWGSNLVPLPGGALFVAHLSGSLSHAFGTGSLLEFEGNWHQGDDAVCHRMKIVDPTKQIPTVIRVTFMNKELTP
jgi:hypothetical protein